MSTSTHKVEVFRLGPVEVHPAADKLEVVRICGFVCCVPKGQYKEGDLIAYIQPDGLVDPARPEFAFLAGEAKECYGKRARIKVKKLRGIVSMGLVIPAPAGAKEGEDVATHYDVTHYNPPEPVSTGGETAAPPDGYHPHYDVDTWYRYKHLFRPGEEILATEKIHGTSGRWHFDGNQMHTGSRAEWKREKEGVVWWRVTGENPELESFCKAHPELTLYGEVFGWVQSLRYGLQQGHVTYAIFDILRGNEWIPPLEAREIGKSLKWVPTVYQGPYDEEKVKALAEGPSLIPGAKHIREGVVISPLVERTDPEVGRVKLKIVSSAYLAM